MLRPITDIKNYTQKTIPFYHDLSVSKQQHAKQNVTYNIVSILRFFLSINVIVKSVLYF